MMTTKVEQRESEIEERGREMFAARDESWPLLHEN